MANVERLLRGSCPEHVRIEMSFDSLHLDSREAASVAMIVCEFVANSIKHAFPDGRRGTILIGGQELDGVVELRCTDDGVGTDESISASAGGGLGLKIIDVSAAQLGAISERPSTGQGSALTVTFQPGS
jgi:two-component sensor histidine kinase